VKAEFLVEVGFEFFAREQPSKPVHWIVSGARSESAR
jgi:hypothetical protein